MYKITEQLFDNSGHVYSTTESHYSSKSMCDEKMSAMKAFYEGCECDINNYKVMGYTPTALIVKSTHKKDDTIGSILMVLVEEVA